MQSLCRERLAGRVATQSSDGIQQLHTVTKRGDTKLLQVLVRRVRQDRLVNLFLAEDRLVLPEARLRSQTRTSMMGAYNRGGAHHGEVKVSRVALGFSGPSQSALRSDRNGWPLTLF